MNHLSQEILSAYVDGQLSIKEKLAAQIHLPLCTDCRRQVESLKQVKELLFVASAQTAPADLVRSIKIQAQVYFMQKHPKLVRSARVRLKFYEWMDFWILGSSAAVGLLAMILTFWALPRFFAPQMRLDSISAAHHRYQQEALVHSSDLSSDEFSNQLFSAQDTLE